jgi:transaldolase
MRPTQELHDLGESLWLDNITRGHLVNGTLRSAFSKLFAKRHRSCVRAGD